MRRGLVTQCYVRLLESQPRAKACIHYCQALWVREEKYVPTQDVGYYINGPNLSKLMTVHLALHTTLPKETVSFEGKETVSPCRTRKELAVGPRDRREIPRQPSFRNETKVHIGNGSMTAFWLDLCCGYHTTFADIFPALLSTLSSPCFGCKGPGKPGPLSVP